MKIIVCIKPVDGEITPFDKAALETALRLSEDVTVIGMCPSSCEGLFQSLTRLGAKAEIISDKLYAGSDTLATGYILSKAIEKKDFDLIICGRQSTDGDTAQVGPSLATMLNIPVITNVLELRAENGKVLCKSRLGNEEAKLPALITVERICELRFPSIRSKAGSVNIYGNEKVKAEPKRCGLSGSGTRVIKTFSSREGKRHCEFIEKERLYSLVSELLLKEPKETKRCEAGKKLPEVWILDRVLKVEAEAIAEKCVYIDFTDPYKLAELAKEKKPEFILWNADLKGRRNAPIAAALMGAGLCADCTQLETDGKKLYMYRPAKGGDITAKIECTTDIKMATVRCETKGSDIIVSAGRGAANALDRVYALASRLGAEKGASRALVDMNLVPYEEQIGLTGKKVSPKIYIAFGISGAVQHTCAIEGADFIIAVNPDKNARIFDYADYGILTEAENI